MSSIKFDYGKDGIEIQINPSWNLTVFRPKSQELIEDTNKSIREAINNPIGTIPLKDIIKEKGNLKQICIVVSDATRPVPSKSF